MSMTATQAQQLYVAYFNRPADTLGLAYWTGKPAAQASAAFSTSAEYTATFAGMSNAQIINAIYTNLFGRPADDLAGLTFWANHLTNGTMTVSNAVTSIAAAAKGTDLTAYNNKVTAASAFTAALDTAAEVIAYSGTAANNAAKTWLSGVTTDATLTAATTTAALNASISGVTAAGTAAVAITPINIALTVNQDVGAGFTGGGGNDIFNALATTLTTGDSLSGGLGSDTLSLSATIAAATGIAGFTLNSVENVSVALTDGNVGVAHALSLNMLNAGAVNASVSGSAATTFADGLILDNLAAGSSVGLSNSTNLNLTANFVAAATAGTADAVSLALNTAASTAATDGIVTIGAGFETLNISTSGSASVVDDIVFGGTAINVTGDQNLTVRQGLDGSLTTINASTYTGRLNITSVTDATTPDALVGTVDVADLTITGGTGNDTFVLTANAAADELNVNAGAGDDTVTIGNVLANASSTNVGDVLNGGDGTDTLTADVDLIDAAAVTTALTGVSKFETLNLNGFADANVVNVANISSDVNRVNLSGVSGAFNNTINYAAGAQTLGLNIAAAVDAGQSLTLDAAGSATTDSLAIVNMLAATGTAQALSATSDLVVTDFETVSINTGSYTTPTAQLVNVVNVGANTLTLSGSNGLTTTAGTGIITATTINASAMTGALIMGAAAASVTTITGGSANDTLIGDTSSTINGGAGNDTITGGATNDTLNGDDGTDTITTGAGTDTVNGGAGNDTIVVGDNLSALDTINGGDGTDTLSAGTASLAAVAALTISDANAFNTRFTSVETLRLTDALNTGTFDLGYLNSLTGVRLDAGINGVETLNGFDSNETLDLRVALSAALTVGVNSATAGASDVLNVAINSAAAGVDFTDLSIANVETLNIAVNEATASATVRAHTIGLTLSQTTVANSGSGAAQTVNITGTESLTIDTAIAAGTINASGLTVVAATDAGLTMGAAFTATTAITGQTITGSGRVDVLLGSTGNDTINAGAGNDTITGGIGTDTIDGGDGADTYQTTNLVGANIEGAGSGTSTGVVINLGATALTNGNVLANSAQNLSSGLTSVAAGQVAYLFNTVAPTNSTVVKTLSNMENITLSGNGINYVVGSATANTIVGGTGVDTILAGDGNDVMTGLAGVDVLTGGAGDDIYAFTAEADLFNANAIVDTITEATTGGTDSLRLSSVAATFTIAVGDVFGTRAVNIEQFTAVASANAYSITLEGAADTDAVALRTIDLSGDTDATGTNVVDLTAVDGSYIVIGSAGVDTITSSIGVDNITGGGGTDAITIASAAGTGIATAGTTSTSTATLDKVFLGNLADNDTINLAAGLLGGTDANYDAFTTNATGAVISLTVVSGAAAGGTVALVTGVYDAVNQTFTAAAEGAGTNAVLVSTAATNATTATDSIVIVGSFGLTSGAFAITDGIITA